MNSYHFSLLYHIWNVGIFEIDIKYVSQMRKYNIDVNC